MGSICLSIHFNHQTDTCIKMGSDERHFNVSLFVRNKVTTVSTSHNRFEEKGEPKPFCLPAYNALPLGQTGSPDVSWFRCVYITLCAHDGPPATFPSARLPPASGGCDLLVSFAHRDNYKLGSVGVWCRRVGRIMHLPVGRSTQLSYPISTLSPTTWYTLAKPFRN